jgi:hypothetical protein
MQPAIMPTAKIYSRVDGTFIPDRSIVMLRRVVELLCVVAALGLGAFLSYKCVHNQLTETQILRETRVSLARFHDGTVAKPFAYRELTPLLARVALDVLHVPDLIRAAPAITGPKIAAICARIGSDTGTTCDQVLAYAAVAFCLCFAFFMTIYATARRMFGEPLIALAALLLAFFVLNAILLQGLSHIYDFGTLFMGTLMIFVMMTRRDLLFLGVLMVACVMKETLFLYSLAYAAACIGHRSLSRVASTFAIQLAGFIIVHGAIRLYFADNAGLGHEYYLPDQISFFTEHLSLVLLLPLLFAVTLVFYQFPLKPETLRRASVIFAPWFALFMVGGEEREVRVIFEVLPIVLLMATDSCARLVIGNHRLMVTD